MFPILYISLLSLSISAACWAEIVTSRSSPESQELAQRQDSAFQPTSRFLPPSSPDPVDAQLLDIVLVASVDGKFRALSRSTGVTLWEMAAAPSNQSSQPNSLDPLVRTIHSEQDPDHIDETVDQETYIIEPQSGEIYVAANRNSNLERFPLTMAELVDSSPFSFGKDADRRIFTGKKTTSLLIVELETGRVKAMNSECHWDPFEDLQSEEIDLDELEGSKHRAAPATEVFIGRTDYHISIARPPVRGIKRTPQILSFSTYGPNNHDQFLQATYQETKDGSYIQGLPNGHVLSFTSRSKEPQPRPQKAWVREDFKSPIVAVFDVLRRTPHRSETFVLLQPQPGLGTFLPTLELETARNHLPNYQSAYVGIVEETGSLFAMSPSRFPLVAFGDAARVGTASTSKPGDKWGDVDDVTHSRKLAARCDDPAVIDRRCLIGVRLLEQGDPQETLRLLLDGPSSRIGAPFATKSALEPTVNTSQATPVLTIDPSKSPSWWAMQSNAWQAVVTIVLLTAVSLWFGIKRNSKKEIVLFSPTAPQTPLPSVTNTQNVDDPITPRPALELPQESPVVSEGSDKWELVTGAEKAEDSERELDVDGEAATPGKKKRPRGRRGGKGKKGQQPSNEAMPELPLTPLTPSTPLTPTPEPSLIVQTPVVSIAPSLVVSENILGYGSHGTVVYKGSLQGRSVAVKRLLRDFVTLASREVSILQESDDHPNVIRYYYQEFQSNFLYIALELCPASLADIVEYPDREDFREIAIAFNAKKALRQITSGLRHLHALKLVHRDIKPQNILIAGPKPGNSKAGYRMLISDFGLCKKLDVDQTSFLPTAYGAMAAGTVGWRAPEILRGEVKLDDMGDESTSSLSSNGTANGSLSAKPTRLTKSVDIFALGCLFYYTLTSGSHPFGDRYEREVNILRNAKHLDGLVTFGEEGAEAVDLIESMLSPEASERPNTTTCLEHPFFWDSGKRLNFLQDASDRFEIMCRDPKDPDLLALEHGANLIVGHDWQQRVDKIFLDNLGKFRKYDGKSVQDLLRALRNKKHHYQDLPDNVKRHLGAMPEGYLTYFTRRYPRLFLHVHSVIRSTSLRQESMFRTYFDVAD